jgi:hypothetical protein
LVWGYVFGLYGTPIPFFPRVAKFKLVRAPGRYNKETMQTILHSKKERFLGRVVILSFLRILKNFLVSCEVLDEPGSPPP